MSSQTAFNVARQIGTNFDQSFTQARDKNAIETILSEAMQTGDPRVVQNSIGRILSSVSPERQGVALQLLQNTYSDLEEKRKLKEEDAAIQREFGLNTRGLGPDIKNQFVSTNMKQNQQIRNAQNALNARQQINPRGNAPEVRDQNQPRNLPAAVPNKSQILSQEELQQQAIEQTQAKLDAGIPTDFETEYNNLNTLNTAAINEENRIKALQQEAGLLGEQKITNVLPNATDEQRALFQRKGEEAYLQGKSQSEINKYLSEQARSFKNTLFNLEKSVKGLVRRGFDKSKNDIQIKIKPLLDEGLYDTARNVLSKGGELYPEQIEETISELGEFPKRILAKLPNYENKMSAIDKQLDLTMQGNALTSNAGRKIGLKPKQKQEIKNNIVEVMNSDPSANLILLRRAYQDKGVDWETFKDLLDDAIKNGDVKLSDDQFESQYDILNVPPLDGLTKFIQKIKLSSIGI